mmetsp:Transcript_36601/g.105244  ORF Transcript_36601/g.105244 Transcript_36601/m.105244 type:complete len:337 (+) Transcript_36601:598-1608(+)
MCTRLNHRRTRSLNKSGGSLSCWSKPRSAFKALTSAMKVMFAAKSSGGFAISSCNMASALWANARSARRVNLLKQPHTKPSVLVTSPTMLAKPVRRQPLQITCKRLHPVYRPSSDKQMLQGMPVMMRRPANSAASARRRAGLRRYGLPFRNCTKQFPDALSTSLKHGWSMVTIEASKKVSRLSSQRWLKGLSLVICCIMYRTPSTSTGSLPSLKLLSDLYISSSFWHTFGWYIFQRPIGGISTSLWFGDGPCHHSKTAFFSLFEGEITVTSGRASPGTMDFCLANLRSSVANTFANRAKRTTRRRGFVAGGFVAPVASAKCFSNCCKSLMESWCTW